MADMTCDLMDIGQAAAGCDEQFAGIGNQIYVAYPEDLQSPPTYDQKKAAFVILPMLFHLDPFSLLFRSLVFDYAP